MLDRKIFAQRLRIFAWSLFDFGNTSFYVIILTVSYPLYFKEIVVGESAYGDLLWGITFSVSMLITAFISPILGAAADEGMGKKRFLLFFTMLCVAATSLLFSVSEGMVIMAMVIVTFANIGFEAGLVFYDAFLPELSHSGSAGKVSGYGFAMGYVGSLVTLMLAYPLLKNGFNPDNLFNVRLSFVLAALIFFIFSLPIFFFIPDQQQRASFQLSFIKKGIDRVINTFKSMSHLKNIRRFLIAYFLYVDAINTVIIFSSLYARETLFMEFKEIILFFAIVQTSAIIGSIYFGFVSDKIGQKRAINITLFIWMFIVLFAYLINDKNLFYILGVLAGIALGSTQATSRSLMSLILPPEKKTEFFGFYSFFSKTSAVVGPLLFGMISSLINQKMAVLSVGILFLFGFLMLQGVKEKCQPVIHN